VGGRSLVSDLLGGGDECPAAEPLQIDLDLAALTGAVAAG
jgi:hypothetical protein